MKLELFAPTERYRGRGPHPVILQTEQIGHLDSEKRGDPQVMVVFNTTLWQTYKKLWKITIFNGKINYKWPFSIANCLFTRGQVMVEWRLDDDSRLWLGRNLQVVVGSQPGKVIPPAVSPSYGWGSHYILGGGWATYPSEKWWSESQMEFTCSPRCGKIWKNHQIPWFQSPPTSVCWFEIIPINYQ